MKKFIALMLVFASLTLSACSSSEAEDSETNDTIAAAEDTAPAETEETAPETEYVRPADEEYVDYRNVHLASDPVYSAADKTLVLYFEDFDIWYPEDAACDVAYISDTAANTIPAVADLSAHPDMKLDNGDYSGVTLKLDEALPTGSFEIMVSFHTYTCSFEMTVE
ncbi:MAG: hypothetical protein IJ334_05185 [Clostridia bacterium]|nr:hypothetical protein [Clostridia bacterium]